MIAFANCKINIGLDVLARREDGYHDLQTLMLPVHGLCDAVELIPAGDSQLKVYGDGVECPPEENLCMKALRLMQQSFGAGGARIYLQKAVPSGAGLGGGSADAAAVMLLCNRAFGLGLTAGSMERAAAMLGSDVPVFIRNRPAIASGRGEILSPPPPRAIAQLEGKHLLIIKPPVHVSTAQAYAGVRPHRPAPTLPERLEGDIRTWKETVANAFEEHIFELHPLLGELKERLYALGALYASMSGSGSALYGIFDRAPDISGLASDLFIYQQVISTDESSGG